VTITLDASSTAVIVSDMWNRHYCKTFSRNIDRLAPRINVALKYFRRYQIPILFMAEDVLSAHEDEPGTKLLASYAHLNEVWYPIDHPPAPGHYTFWNQCICTDGTKCLGTTNWDRTHEGIERHKFDLMGGWGQHTGFIRAHGIDTLLYCGITSNICVLSHRQFSVCQSLSAGMNCILLKNLTESYVPYEKNANQLVIEYYEEHICPTARWESIEFSGMGIWERYNTDWKEE